MSMQTKQRSDSERVSRESQPRMRLPQGSTGLARCRPAKAHRSAPPMTPAIRRLTAMGVAFSGVAVAAGTNGRLLDGPDGVTAGAGAAIGESPTETGGVL